MTTSTNNTSNLLLPGGVAKSFVAGEALDGDLGEILVFQADGEVVKVASQGGGAGWPDWAGVLVQIDGTAAGATALVCVAGPCKVKAGGNIDEGDILTGGADARAEQAATGDWPIGRALSAGVDGDLIPMVVAVGHAVIA